MFANACGSACIVCLLIINHTIKSHSLPNPTSRQADKNRSGRLFVKDPHLCSLCSSLPPASCAPQCQRGSRPRTARHLPRPGLWRRGDGPARSMDNSKSRCRRRRAGRAGVLGCKGGAPTGAEHGKIVGNPEDQSQKLHCGRSPESRTLFDCCSVL